MTDSFINDLDRLISERKENPQEGSYTNQLLDSGLDRILRKVGEETGEVIIAAKNRDSKELLNETADLLFHLIVMLREQGLSFSDVVGVLEKRHG